MTLRVLGFEAFDGGSHRAVREAISAHSAHTWQWLTLPGRAWKWRMRLGAVQLIARAHECRAFDEQPDVIFATSMLSIADLRALLPRAMRNTPIVLYMHENQAAYPVGPGVDSAAIERDAHFALTSYTSILAADSVIWNSAWNRDSFADACEELLAHADGPSVDVRAQLDARRSSIIWPPVDVPLSMTDRQREGTSPDAPIRIVWPHRWEHDKGPDALLDLARAMTHVHNLRWVLLGEQHRTVPEPLQVFLDEFADVIDHAGYIPDRDAYRAMLASCDWVLSTASHEFFGIAVVEALMCGCLPWLPDRLSYPELLPAVARGLSPAQPPDDPDAVRDAIRAHLTPAMAANAVTAIDRELAIVAGS